MIRILAPRIFVYQNMVSAETFLDVKIPTHVQTTFALLPQMEKPTLALILLVVAHKMQPSSLLTMHCFPTKIKLIG